MGKSLISEKNVPHRNQTGAERRRSICFSKSFAAEPTPGGEVHASENLLARLIALAYAVDHAALFVNASSTAVTPDRSPEVQPAIMSLPPNSGKDE